MHLKKVEIFGFKSFADKTEIHFEKGITCVVGPNGCGKSNISDSIRWVLGERSAKLLRGSKMEDVIFSGTEFRKPLGMAEVSLTIDNSDKVLPIGFDEVVITRRLYRSGESEYLINKTQCRYKDIQDLILDTGVGSNSYSMIEQGRIDYILNAQEDERRFLIEEAAGISKYKVKKEEALRKLERTEANLLRLNDIVSEVDKNIRYAERQAKRAEKYKEKLEEVKKLEIQKALIEIELLEKEKTSLSTEHESLVVSVKNLEAELASHEEGYRNLESQVTSIESRYSEIERKKYDAKLRLSQIEDRIRANEDKRTELAKFNEDLERECVLSQAKIENYGDEIRRKEQEIASLEEEASKLSESTAVLKTEFSKCSASLSGHELTVKDYQTRLFELAREIAEAGNRIMRIEIDVQNECQKKIKAQQAIERLAAEKAECVARLEGLGEDPAILQDLAAKNDELSRRTAERDHLSERLAQLDRTREQKRRDLTESISQVDILEELEREGVFEGATENQILEEAARDNSMIKGFVKSVSDVIDVKAGFEGALHAALADWAHALIVEHHDHVEEVVGFAKNAGLKDFSLVINRPGAENGGGHTLELEGFQGWATEFVSIQDNYRLLIESHLKKVAVVDRMTKDRIEKWSFSANGIKIVSMDGYLLGPGLKLQYLGDLNQRSAQARRRNLQELEQRTKDLQAEIEVLEAERGHLDSQLKTCSSEIENLEAELMDKNILYQSSSRLKESLVGQVQHFDEEIGLLESEIRHAADDAVRLGDEKTALESLLGDLKQKESAEQSILQNELRNVENLEKAKDEVFRSLNEEEQKVQRFADRQRYMAESVEMLQKSLQSEQASLEKKKSQIVENRRLSEDMLRENEARTADMSELRTSLFAIEEESSAIAEERTALSRSRTTLFTELQEKKTELDGFRDREHAIRMKVMEIGYKDNAVHERMNQTYHVDLRTLDKTPYTLENVNVLLLDEEITSLKEKLESLGTVNLLAIEEYESLKERFNFLDAQKQDLEKSREDLLEAIRKINKTTKKLFEETFAAVQAGFRDYFRVLFGGGEAELILIDEANPLESGIDIMVRPPGKKNSTITLLSGGEKALTATALLFALFKIKPSPFCVLDEIDAPLDESNVHRFLEVVKSFLGRTQFIIVTHNRKTISTGDSLYGVTMEEAGVSKIVSVKLTDDAPAASRQENTTGIDEVVNRN